MEYPLTIICICILGLLGVLILILMEYPLTRIKFPRCTGKGVLILILMEYPLTTFLHIERDGCRICLNPYSNGIPSDDGHCR